MATLERRKSNTQLATGLPTPFPREELVALQMASIRSACLVVLRNLLGLAPSDGIPTESDIVELSPVDLELARSLLALVGYLPGEEDAAAADGQSDAFESLVSQLRVEPTGDATLDALLENVGRLCKRRAEETAPPDYYEESLPDYDTRSSFDSTKKPLDPPDDKMRMDLEKIASAIDRLLLVAPQIHNQRVELRDDKIAQLELAKSSKGKGKEPQLGDLEKIVEMLAKATERSLRDQAVVLEGSLEQRVRDREVAKKEAMLSALLFHSSAGRLHSQDATLHLGPRERDPEALITLPDFLREPIPRTDPAAMLSLPEFVREPPPKEWLEKHHTTVERKRSLSAPPLAWLKTRKKREDAPNPVGAFDVVYVAEYHETLQHILLFFVLYPAAPTLSRSTSRSSLHASSSSKPKTVHPPLQDLSAHVLPPVIGPPEDGDHLVIKLKSGTTSLPLILPAHVPPGQKEITDATAFWQVRMSVVPKPKDDEDDDDSLLDAPTLTRLSPSSFNCISCSLPLVSVDSVTYRDLPSSHWEELVESWMCHEDLKVSKEVQEREKRGFIPRWDGGKGEVFVGGSYMLLPYEAIVHGNLFGAPGTPSRRSISSHNRSPSVSTLTHSRKSSLGTGKTEDFSQHHEHGALVKCLCGATIGRSKPMGGENETCTYRLLKHALKPVRDGTELAKIPLSAYIVNDMMEYVAAHATYRFVIRDEEEDRVRMLIWLFKPRMRLSYTTPGSIKKSKSVSAAKVLYKTIKPGEVVSDDDLKRLLDRYPGFPQSEPLSYPMTVCRKLAGLLLESNLAYPESLRTMTGLEVGWLARG